MSLQFSCEEWLCIFSTKAKTGLKDLFTQEAELKKEVENVFKELGYNLD